MKNGLLIMALSVFFACQSGGDGINAHGALDDLKVEAGAFNVGNVEGILSGYFEGVDALAKDDFDKAMSAFDRYHEAVHALKDEAAQPYKKMIAKVLHRIEESKNIDELRSYLQPLSFTTYQFAEKNEVKLAGVNFFKCTMVKAGTGEFKSDGYWLATKDAVENPYHGAGMFACGSKVAQIEE